MEVVKEWSGIGVCYSGFPGGYFSGRTPLSNFKWHHILDAPNRVSFFQKLKGNFLCWKCSACCLDKNKARRIRLFQSSATSRSYDIDTLITCTSLNVVYMLISQYGLQYVGCTIRAVNVRINDHEANIKRGFPKHSVLRHYLECHEKNSAGTTFVAIDRFTPHWRGSSVKWEISKLETWQIFELKSYVSYRQNVDWDVNCFINNR